MTRETFLDLVKRARSGDREAMGILLEKYRPWLKILASRALDPIVSARLSGSDIVQQTCLEAHRDFQHFRGQTEPELIAWLGRMLSHNIAEATQVHVLAEKRSVRLEHNAADVESPEVVAELAAAGLSSPSSREMRSEQAVRLAEAMRELPQDQFEALRLRYLEGCSLVQIAARMERSEAAVASLLKRGLQGLRSRRPCEEDD
jgi:RNA polymerase sigma-70 factor (ECF subfamily)